MMIWYFLVLLSSVLMGLATIVEKISLKVEHATAFSAALAPIVALLSLLFLPWANFQLTSEQWVILIVFSAFNAYTFLLSARVFKHGELSIASPAFSSIPTLFTVLLAFLFLGEVLTPFQYVVIIAMVLAIYFLLFTKQRRGEKTSFDGKKYTYMIILYSFLSAATTIVTKYLLEGMNAYAFLILSSVFMSVSFLVMISVRYGGISEIFDSVRKYRLPLAVNAILTLGYRVTFYVALVTAPVSLAYPLKNTIYVVITVAFAGMLFGERHIPRKLTLGIALLLLSYLLTINI